MMPIFGGWLADTKAGKFSTILFSAVIYLLGTLLLPLGSIAKSDNNEEKSQWAANHVTTNRTFMRAVFITALFLVAVGTGGIKANVSPLGAEQVLHRGPAAIKSNNKCHHFIIIIITIIIVIVIVLVVVIISSFSSSSSSSPSSSSSSITIPPMNTPLIFLLLTINVISFPAFFSWFYWFINIGALVSSTFVVYLQQNVSFFYGNLVPAFFLILALIIFLSGKQKYICHPPTGSVLTNTLNIIKEGIKGSRRPSLSRSLVNHWLDRAKVCFGGSYSSLDVEDVKRVYRLLPIFGSLIIYWTVYNQVSLDN